MTLATWSKILAIAGATISTIGTSALHGGWAIAVSAVGSGVVAISVVLASQTSAGHPDGAETTTAQSAPLVGK